ncbi:MAG TPA: RNA-binding protein [Vibrio sp.]|nr:RNA-binding protein [Vibrio sp.]
MTENQVAFLNNYLDTLSEEQRSSIPQVYAEYFCADEYNANECARLVDVGIKRASCSLKQGYDIDDEPLPLVGRLTVVLNWSQEPVCIIEHKDVSICRFSEVTEEFAALEGEGDGSYQWWHNAHLQFFTQYAAEVGAQFTEESELVLERFEKVYPY